MKIFSGLNEDLGFSNQASQVPEFLNILKEKNKIYLEDFFSPKTFFEKKTPKENQQNP